MITIAAVSDKIGEYLGKQAGRPSEIKKLCYGVECILVMTISIATILVTGWLLGVFAETAWIASAAIIMKYITGGPHLSGFLRCTGFSAILFITAAWMIKLSAIPSPIIFLILAVLGSGFVLYYGPLFTLEFHFSKMQIFLRRILSTVLLIVMALINFWFKALWSNALMVGVLITVMLKTPVGILMVDWLDQITKRKEVQST